jgi:hypothetical protein
MSHWLVQAVTRFTFTLTSGLVMALLPPCCSIASFDVGDQIAIAHPLALFVDGTFEGDLQDYFFGFGQFNFSLRVQLRARHNVNGKARAEAWAETLWLELKQLTHGEVNRISRGH